MLRFFTQKGWQPLLAGVVGMVIGSAGTWAALTSPVNPYTDTQPVQFAQAQEEDGVSEDVEEDLEVEVDEQSGDEAGDAGTNEQTAEEAEAQLKRMKQGVKQGRSALERMEKRLQGLTSKTIGLPGDCSDALVGAKSIFDAVEQATTFEDLQDAGVEDLESHFETLNECQVRMEKLSRVPGVLKKVDPIIRRTEAQWTLAKKRTPVDVKKAIADGDAALTLIKQSRAKINDLLKQGDIDEIEHLVQDEIYGKFDDVAAATTRIEASKNPKQFVSRYNGNLASLLSTIQRLKRQGQDTVTLEALAKQAQIKYQLVKIMNTGTDAYKKAAMELADMGQVVAAAVGSTEE